MTELSLEALGAAAAQPDSAAAAASARTLCTCEAAALEHVLGELASLPELDGGLCAWVATWLWRRYPPKGQRATALTPTAVERLAEIYRRLPQASTARHLLLRTLAGDAGTHSLAAFAELLVEQPPALSHHCDLALAPLFQRRSYNVEALFPKLLSALSRPALAVGILDLANFLYRSGQARPHVAAARVEQLMELFGQIAQRLARLEEQPEQFSQEALGRIAAEGTALLIALCDALALIGDERAIGKLRFALALSHRRLRTEAAAALVRLGYADARPVLTELAADPVVRTRVLAYAAELGMEAEIAEEYRTAAARGEGMLCAWLAQPQQFGRLPDKLELLATRRMYWPGLDDPRDCCLFRYEYAQQPAVAGVGLTGPTVLVLRADVSQLGADDLYALFAGLDAQHEQIRELRATELEGEDQQDRVPPTRHSTSHLANDRQPLREFSRKCLTQLTSAGYEDLVLELVGDFLGLPMAVATARRDGRAGVVVVSPNSVQWFPREAYPLDAGAIYALVKGRRLMEKWRLED